MLTRLAVAGCLVLSNLACATRPEATLETTAEALRAAELTTFDGTSGCCLEGDVAVCSHYANKKDVFIAPNPGMPDGDYFFAVVLPTHQSTGILDGFDGNLSDPVSGATPGDLGVGGFVEDRTFSIVNGRVSKYSGSHPFALSPDGSRAIGLAPFDEASAQDGKYVAAVCPALASSGSACWFDAFEVVDGAACPDVASFRASRRAPDRRVERD